MAPPSPTWIPGPLLRRVRRARYKALYWLLTQTQTGRAVLWSEWLKGRKFENQSVLFGVKTRTEKAVHAKREQSHSTEAERRYSTEIRVLNGLAAELIGQDEDMSLPGPARSAAA